MRLPTVYVTREGRGVAPYRWEILHPDTGAILARGTTTSRRKAQRAGDAASERWHRIYGTNPTQNPTEEQP